VGTTFDAGASLDEWLAAYPWASGAGQAGNGDGYADFIVSAPNAGRVSIFLGGATVGATERATLTMTGEFFGLALGF
jgi:hypothetical protein